MNTAQRAAKLQGGSRIDTKTGGTKARQCCVSHQQKGFKHSARGQPQIKWQPQLARNFFIDRWIDGWIDGQIDRSIDRQIDRYEVGKLES